MWVLLGWIMLACAPATVPAAAPTPAPAATAPTAAVLDHVTWIDPRADATGPIPTVIAVHGLGDRPERFVAFAQGLTTPVRIVAPRGPLPAGPGASWYAGKGGAGLADEVRARVDDIRRLIAAVHAERPIAGTPVITGFSQGGILAYAVATLAPEVVAGAVPVAGALPAVFVDEAIARGRAAPIRAFHGDADTRLAVDLAAPGVARLSEAGLDARLTVAPGVAHAVSAEQRGAIKAAIDAMLTASLDVDVRGP